MGGSRWMSILSIVFMMTATILTTVVSPRWKTTQNICKSLKQVDLLEYKKNPLSKKTALVFWTSYKKRCSRKNSTHVFTLFTRQVFMTAINREQSAKRYRNFTFFLASSTFSKGSRLVFLQKRGYSHHTLKHHYSSHYILFMSDITKQIQWQALFKHNLKEVTNYVVFDKCL